MPFHTKMFGSQCYSTLSNLESDCKTHTSFYYADTLVKYSDTPVIHPHVPTVSYRGKIWQLCTELAHFSEDCG